MAAALRRGTVVLGGSGFLGVHALEAIAAGGPEGGEVLSASREPPPAALACGARHAPVDALRPGEVEALLEAERPQRVLLCTALARGADCDSYPGLARALNVELPARVARWCAARGARLVHVSTDLVFGGAPPAPPGFSERDAPAPRSLYGATKAEGERAALSACPSALVARLPLLYGDSRGRGLGASDSLLAALERGESPLLFEDEWRTPLDVRDAAAALAELLGGALSGVLHVGGPQRISRAGLGRAVLEARSVPPELARRVRTGTRAEAGLGARPGDACLDSARARGLLRAPLRAPRAALAG